MAPSALSKNELLKHVAYNSAETIKDNSDYDRAFGHLSTGVREHLVAILRSDEFSAWARSQQSRLLFINCIPNSPHDSTSFSSCTSVSEVLTVDICSDISPDCNASTYLCMQLHKYLVPTVPEQQGPIVLFFLCKIDSDDGLGLVSDLIGQLAIQWPAHCPWPDDIRPSEEPEPPVMLMIHLRKLLLKIRPADTVYCLIDDVNIHENSRECADDIEDVITRLESWTTGDCVFRLRCVLKVLLVCQYQSELEKFKLIVWDDERVLTLDDVDLKSPVAVSGIHSDTHWKELLRHAFE